MNVGDTIAAISTSVGRGARMILRLSGPDAFEIVGGLVENMPAGPGAIRTSAFWANHPIPCWIYRFDKPNSYTGEDLVELHIPGNPIIARELLNEMILGRARLSEAGEFTARAFFNGRMNLTQAEGVAGVIAAQNREELEASRRLLEGELAMRLRPLMDRLAGLLSKVEAGIDFSDQEITFVGQEELSREIGDLGWELDQILKHSGRFEEMKSEPEMVLAGRPNAGKSTLLNALCGRERAVVSSEAGTTRDRLSAEVVLKRGKIRLVDIAGLDDRPEGDEINKKMRRRAREEIRKADRLIGVRDIRDSRPPLDFGRTADAWILTHADLDDRESAEGLKVSAVTGMGMETLRRRLDELAFGEPRAGVLTLNARHVKSMNEARVCLERGLMEISGGHETLAYELRIALDELGRIAGQVTPDDVLGRVFSAFCIGK